MHSDTNLASQIFLRFFLSIQSIKYKNIWVKTALYIILLRGKRGTKYRKQLICLLLSHVEKNVKTPVVFHNRKKCKSDGDSMLIDHVEDRRNNYLPVSSSNIITEVAVSSQAACRD